MNSTYVQENLSLESLVGQVADEFLERQKRGERPSIEEYAERYPHAADMLRKVLASLEALDASLGGDAAEGEPASGVLGDFRILRELGRGGMGVVYEAEQISLNRRVALKVLPFAATMDPRHLQRFKNEAQAAACLQHPHIVAVHGVGCERGVHFFAMQLIEGFTLAELIEHLRQTSAADSPAARPNATTLDVTPPGSTLEAKQGDNEKPSASPKDHPAPSATPAASTLVNNALASTLAEQAAKGQAYYRTVAGWGIQAAAALEHAHQFGIVHRDVKPGNLMIDARGQLWVTDFGLARTSADTGLTMTGDLVGTLRYMSPEQALAKNGVVDHRSDVYALGVTLYELLTLRPAVDGKDRQELLEQIAIAEPIPPRKLRPDVPADLETIVLKAMAREPEERYKSAKDLAADLASFLDDRPIQARRPPWRTRLARWARRRKALVRGAAAVLVTALVIVAGSVGWVTSDRAARRAENERAVRSALDESEDYQRRQQLPEAMSAARRAVGLLTSENTDPALATRARDRLADLQLLEGLDNATLTVLTPLEAKQDDLAYEQVVQRWGLDLSNTTPEQAAERIRRSTVAIEVAAALDEWAVVVRGRARGPADQQWKALLKIARAADPDPWRAQVRDALLRPDAKALVEIVTPNNVAQLWPGTITAVADALIAIDMAERAEALLREAQRRHPDHFRANEGLGLFLLDRGSPEALHFLTAALALRPHDPIARHTLGFALLRNNRYDDAIAEFREVIRIKAGSAIAHVNLGTALAEKGLLDDAIVVHREAVRLSKDFALFHNNLGISLHKKGLLDDAIVAFREAIRLGKRDLPDLDAATTSHVGTDRIVHRTLSHDMFLYKEGFDSPEPRFGLGLVLQQKGLLDDAIAEFRDAVKLSPEVARYHQHLGICLAANKRPEEAVTAFREAVRLGKGAAQHRRNLGLALLKLNRLDEAIAELRELVKLNKEDAEAYKFLGEALSKKGLMQDAVRAFADAARLQKDDASAIYNLGLAHDDAGNTAEAIAAYRRALSLKSDLAKAHCNLGQALRRTGEYAEALKHLRRGHELGTKEPGWKYPSAEWVKTCEEKIALDAQVADVLGGKAPLPPAGLVIKLMQHCFLKGDAASEARLQLLAFDAYPGLETGGWKGRHHSTMIALRAAAGHGRKNTLTIAERRVVRARALAALRAEFDEIAKLSEKTDVETLALASRRFANWGEPELAELWRPDHLRTLTESEFKACQALLDDFYRLENRLASLCAETRFAGKLAATKAVHDVKLVAGRTYVIDLESPEFDPFLRLHDAAGALLLENDDREPEKNKSAQLFFKPLDSRLIFQPKHDGLYRLAVSAFDKAGRGGYVLHVREFAARDFSE